MEALRGVIDRFEGTLAVIVLDDEQQLLWPCASLPALARPGTAVRLHLVPPQPSAATEEICPDESASLDGSVAALPARVQYNAASGQWQLVLANGSALHWPEEGTPLEADQLVQLRLVVDIEDTVARRKRVQSLLDELFGNSSM
ncbi:MAG: DUF3006 domain-containing protein [Anaerolineae bacterium]